MTDPDKWPVWVQIILFTPGIIGASSVWLPLAKSSRLRTIQLSCMAYTILFAVFFLWKSVIGYAIVALVAAGFMVFLFLRRQDSN